MVVLSLSRMARGRLIVRPVNEAVSTALRTPALRPFRTTDSTSLTAVSPSPAEAAAGRKRSAMPMSVRG